MLTVYLRIEMIVLALAILGFVVLSIIRYGLSVKNSLVWLALVVLMTVIAVFPQIAEWLCRITRIETPTNLLFLGGILILMALSFSQTINNSRQAKKIKELVQIVSIERYLNSKNKEKTVEKATDEHKEEP